MESSKRTIRVPIMMTEEESRRLDDWRFGHRVESRAEAIRRLIEIGMAADPVLQHDTPPKRKAKS